MGGGVLDSYFVLSFSPLSQEFADGVESQEEEDDEDDDDDDDDDAMDET